MIRSFFLQGEVSGDGQRRAVRTSTEVGPRLNERHSPTSVRSLQFEICAARHALPVSDFGRDQLAKFLGRSPGSRRALLCQLCGQPRITQGTIERNVELLDD